MLEPCAVKVASTVLRRGLRCEMGFLSDNYELDLKNANEGKNALDLFKKDMITFLRMYEFLSQIVDYADEELLKLSAFVKALIPNLKTYNPKDPINIDDVKLSHYKLHKQKKQDISLKGDEVELGAIGDVGSAVAKDPQKELLSTILTHMNALFEGELTDEDMINYANTIKDKMSEDSKLVEQVRNNTKEQAMIGGFSESLNDAVIDSLDVHKDLAAQVLSKDKIRDGFADIVYELIAKGLKAS